MNLLIISSEPAISYWADFYNVNHFRIEDQNTSFSHNSLTIDFNKDKSVWSLLESIIKTKNISTCYTSKEYSSAFAYLVNKTFDLDLKSCSNFNNVNNKFYMRERLRAEGYSNIPYERVFSTSDISCFINSHGKSILKPINGYGSKNLTILDRASSDKVKDLKIDETDYIIEKFIEGDEFSIEAFTYSGENKLIGITDKFIDPSTCSEKGHIFPATLSDEKKELIWKTVDNYLSCLGLLNGPSHTEVKVKNNEIYMIETHNRPAGDHIPQIVEMSTGFNIHKTSVGWYSKNITKDEHKITLYGFTGIFFFFANKSGKLKKHSELDALRWIPGIKEIMIYHPINANIQKTTTTFNRIGHVIIQSNSREECIQQYENIDKLLNIEIG
jgi:biotin carboxylase